MIRRKADYLYQRPGSQNWWIRFQFPPEMNRKKVQRSLGTADRREAEFLALPLIQQHKRDLYLASGNVSRKIFVKGVTYRYPLGESTLQDGTQVVATKFTAVLIKDGALVGQERNYDLDWSDVTATFDPEAPQATSCDAPRPKPKSDTDLALLDEYLTYKGHASTGAYAGEARSAWAEFKAFTGGKLIKVCTRTDGMAYVKHLRERGLKTATIVKKVNFLAAPVNHANETGDLSSNPFFRVVDQKDDAQDRLCFDATEMARASEHMLPKLGADERLLWLIMAATGMRHSEVFPIREEFEEGGIRYVRVGGKTESSKRSVPLPDCILPHLPAKITGLLFEDPKLKNVSKNLLRALRRTVTEDPRKVVYSLRHRAHTRLREIECPDDVQKEIVGHENGDHGNYGKFPIRVLKRWIDQIGL